jgi:glycosyltransferase involved in cell wall biosynthesis
MLWDESMMKNQYPKISIVTPSYNQRQFIEDNIQSVLNQKYPNIEHIVIDGASTDGTIDVLKKYDHLKWISEPDNGQADAINKGLRISTGTIWAYLNTDDYYERNAIWKAVEYFLKYPKIDMVYSNYYILENGIKKRVLAVPFDYGYLLYLKYLIPQQTVFIRKRVLDDVGEFDDELFLTMDLEMWIRIGQKNAIRYVNDFFATFRIHDDAKSSNLEWRRTIYPKELQKIYEKYRKAENLPTSIIRNYYALKKKFMRLIGEIQFLSWGAESDRYIKGERS